jgi:hypothetical protein
MLEEILTWAQGNNVAVAIGIGVIISIVLISFIINFNNAKEWLLYAVAAAEKEFGGGTGELKLRQVYDAFLSKFPVMKLFIPFPMFSSLVDSSLDSMREVLNKSAATQAYVEGAQTPAANTTEQENEAS